MDAVVVCCHGGPGEDGSLQAALDLAGIRHAGPSVVLAQPSGWTSWRSRGVAGADLPTLPRRLLTPESASVDFPGPYIVKPRFGGSSIGIEVVVDLPTAVAVCKSSVHLSNGAVIRPLSWICSRSLDEAVLAGS